MDDDVPRADPAIQAEYEAALGQFLMSFNAVENSLSEALDMAIEKSRRPDLKKRLRFKGYCEKVRGLAFLALAHPQWIDQALLDELDELGNERNVLAHDRFDQNPFDGTYVIRSRRRDPLTKTPDDLMHATEWAEKVRHRIRTLVAQFTFDDVSDDESQKFGSPSAEDEDTTDLVRLEYDAAQLKVRLAEIGTGARPGRSWPPCLPRRSPSLPAASHGVRAIAFVSVLSPRGRGRSVVRRA